MSERLVNFSAGPSVLPLEVLEDISVNLTNLNGCGQSILEMSHRSKEFIKILEEAEADLRKLMSIPENYKVLFLQGGGTLQFSMIPMNLMTKNKKADYIVTGTWAKKAAAEAKKYGDVNIVASSEDKSFSYIPKLKASDFRQDADYVYICLNNTIYGTKYAEIPDTGDIPLVADMSSCILSEDIDVTKFALIFAGAQKNIGPAGLTIVIVDEKYLGNADENTPTYLNYQVHADAKSEYNTPPCFAIYAAGLVFKHLINKGGISKVSQEVNEKAKLLYDAIDKSQLFQCPVAMEDRSKMNVVFVTGDQSLDKKFVEEAKAKGLINLNGHRSIGGMRASIYNAMDIEGVQRLVDFMAEFEKAND